MINAKQSGNGRKDAKGAHSIFAGEKTSHRSLQVLSEGIKDDVALLLDVHAGLRRQEDEVLCSGSYRYYHYGCDGVDDRGWGCGYRTLQTLCSWLQLNRKSEKTSIVPSISCIQSALVEMGDKGQDFLGSKQWIGSFEVCLCLDHFYDVPCKIIHVNKGADLVHHLPELKQHFSIVGSPIMMGGETDNASKGIVGVRLQDPALLVVDPHFSKAEKDVGTLQALGYVKWVPVTDFHMNSFYNMCLPKHIQR